MIKEAIEKVFRGNRSQDPEQVFSLTPRQTLGQVVRTSTEGTLVEPGIFMIENAYRLGLDLDIRRIDDAGDLDISDDRKLVVPWGNRLVIWSFPEDSIGENRNLDS